MTMIVDDILRQSIREILTSWIAAVVQERENGDRRFLVDFSVFRELIARARWVGSPR
ncbi:hypothetical protein [Mesorhizobium sp.]|uniref:hypothetical protein n=1 Tax=Mesorhizobium sp. TaxID=1871066 RepID=UPI0025C6DE39|nr:hypothetical protein [Mesorhizobium sp.]